MKYFCENRDGKLYIRGKCAIKKDGKYKDDYSAWTVKELNFRGNRLADEEGRLLWRVRPDNTVVKEPSELIPQKPRPTLEDLESRITALEAR